MESESVCLIVEVVLRGVLGIRYMFGMEYVEIMMIISLGISVIRSESSVCATGLHVSGVLVIALTMCSCGTFLAHSEILGNMELFLKCVSSRLARI